MVRAICRRKVVDRKTTKEQMDMLALKETIDQQIGQFFQTPALCFPLSFFSLSSTSGQNYSSSSGITRLQWVFSHSFFSGKELTR